MPAETPRSSEPFQAGEACPYPARYGSGPCSGVMELKQVDQWIGTWETGREKITTGRWRCTTGHRACEGPGCRNQQPLRWHARFCSDRCRLRAWRIEKRATAAVSGGES